MCGSQNSCASGDGCCHCDSVSIVSHSSLNDPLIVTRRNNSGEKSEYSDWLESGREASSGAKWPGWAGMKSFSGVSNYHPEIA